MAGYYLYSLDASLLEAFLAAPAPETVRIMAGYVSDLLDDFDASIEDDDPLADWPIEIDELVPVLTEHLKKEVWYSDFSDVGKKIWEEAFTELCEHRKPNSFQFACESDGIYWNIVDEVRKFHNQPEQRLTEMEITHFGNRPLRFWTDKRLHWGDWHPYHSMHTPQEVTALAEQFSAAEEAIRNSRFEDAATDFDEFMPILDRMQKHNRILFVQVDT